MCHSRILVAITIWPQIQQPANYFTNAKFECNNLAPWKFLAIQYMYMCNTAQPLWQVSRDRDSGSGFLRLITPWTQNHTASYHVVHPCTYKTPPKRDVMRLRSRSSGHAIDLTRALTSAWVKLNPPRVTCGSPVGTPWVWVNLPVSGTVHVTSHNW